MVVLECGFRPCERLDQRRPFGNDLAKQLTDASFFAHDVFGANKLVDVLLDARSTAFTDASGSLRPRSQAPHIAGDLKVLWQSRRPAPNQPGRLPADKVGFLKRLPNLNGHPLQSRRPCGVALRNEKP